MASSSADPAAAARSSSVESILHRRDAVARPAPGAVDDRHLAVGRCMVNTAGSARTSIERRHHMKFLLLMLPLSADDFLPAVAGSAVRPRPVEIPFEIQSVTI